MDHQIMQNQLDNKISDYQHLQNGIMMQEDKNQLLLREELERLNQM